MISSEINTQLSLPVMESFYTIQGEGYHQGKAAYFVRLGGCDVGCVWCDVKDSWEMGRHPLKTIENIIAEIKSTPAPMVVVTGGEPLMHDLDYFTSALKLKGLSRNIETSGSHPLSGEWDWICLSPKKFKPPLEDILIRAHELKVVIFHKSDFAWAEKYADAMSSTCKLYLQPEWSKDAVITPLIVEYIKQHPRWELSLQLHKYINVP